MQIKILKGLPASGKSTWAENYVKMHSNWHRVNKDSIRAMLGGYRPNDEARVLDMRDSMIGILLRDKRNVIVDDTNLHPKHEKRIREIADLYLAEVEVVFFDAMLETCIMRDAARKEPVGEKVIRRMWKQFLAPKMVPMEYAKQPEMLVHTVICDIDGTLALINDRTPYDTANCAKDLVNEPVKKLVNNMNHVLLVSGRMDTFRDETEKWLSRNNIGYYGLFMRKAGDYRKDCIVKEEIYRKEIEGKYYVDFILDDRNQVVEMWRGLKLPCFQVAPGDF